MRERGRRAPARVAAAELTVGQQGELSSLQGWRSVAEVTARWLALGRVMEEGMQMVSVAAASASSWRRRRWRWPVFPAEDRGTGELDLERERYGSAEKKRGNIFKMVTRETVRSAMSWVS
jgi:hypothetical protein